jgi:hypothetical protein
MRAKPSALEVGAKGEGADMSYLVELPVGVADGSVQVVGVEIEHAADGLVDVSRPGQAIARATRSLGEMLVGIRPVAESLLDGFAGMADTPDEIGFEFGLSLSADANLVVATTAAQAHFKVTLAWRPPPRPQSGDAPTAAVAEEEP